MRPDAIAPRWSMSQEGLSGSPRFIGLSLGVIAIIMTIAALQEVRLFAIPTVLAGLVALALSPAALALERTGLPRALAAALLLIAALAASSAALYVLAPSAEHLSRQLPDIVRDLERMIRAVETEVAESVDGASTATADEDESGGLVETSRDFVTDTLLGAPTLVGAIIYGVFLTFFLLSERAQVHRGILALGSGQLARLRLGRAMRDVRRHVAAYLLVIALINIALGIAVAAAFWALEMPNPAAWGVLMTLLNFMPYLGPLMMNVIVAVVGVVILPSPEDVLPAIAVLVVFNTIEGYVLTPSIVSRQVKAGALAVFLAIAFGAWMWGAAGALLATPALIVGRAFARRVAGRAKAG